MEVDWTGLFAFEVSPLELFIRGTIVYWSVFLVFRFVIKRVGASVALSNILVVVLIADAVSTGFHGDSKSVAGAVMLALTIGFWNFAIEFMEHNFHWFERFVTSPPTLIVHDGEYVLPNMKKHLLSKEEVEVKLRQEGEEDIRRVKRAFVENDGNISFIMQK